MCPPRQFPPLALTQASLLSSYVIVQLCQRFAWASPPGTERHSPESEDHQRDSSQLNVRVNTVSHDPPSTGIKEGAFLLPVITEPGGQTHGDCVTLQDGHRYRSLCSALILTMNACCKLDITEEPSRRLWASPKHSDLSLLGPVRSSWHSGGKKNTRMYTEKRSCHFGVISADI